MACDRIVRFPRNTPTRLQVGDLLRDYMGLGGGATIEWKEDQHRFYVSLMGHCSSPVHRHRARLGLPSIDDGQPQERWIEVWIGEDDTVDVLTRHQDEFVHAVADGLVQLLVRYWDGVLEKP